MIWLLLTLLVLGGVIIIVRKYVFRYLRLRDVLSLGRLAWDAEKHLRWIYNHQVVYVTVEEEEDGYLFYKMPGD